MKSFSVCVLKNHFLLLTLISTIYFSCKKEKLEIAFSEINSGTEKNIYNVFQLSADTLFACGGKEREGFILQSTDAGNSWKIIYTNFLRPVHSVCFNNSLNGFCGGDSTNIFITHDGGNSWNEHYDFNGVPNQYRVPLHKLFFTDSENAFAIGGKKFGRGVIYHSSNGGNNWTTDGFEHELRDAAKSVAGIFSVGYGIILTSTDMIRGQFQTPPTNILQAFYLPIIQKVLHAVTMAAFIKLLTEENHGVPKKNQTTVFPHRANIFCAWIILKIQLLSAALQE